MRKINTADAFKMARVIRNANAKEEITVVFDKITKAKEEGKDIEEVQKQAGMEFVAFLIDACGVEEVEQSLYVLISGIAEVKPEEIADQPLNETIELIKEIAKNNNLQDFLSQAVGLM